MKNKLIENKDTILSLLLSLVVAFGLWLYVITVENPEYEKTYYNIPVVLQDKERLMERGLMVSGDAPTVTLVLRGDRATLNSLNENNINVFANVANIDKSGTHQLTYSISYPGNVRANTVSTQSGSTDLITLKVENRMKKQVPVIPVNVGASLPSNFSLNIDKAYDMVEVIGPESVVSQIQRAEIRLDLTGKTEDIQGEYPYILCDSAGNPVDMDDVTTNMDKVHLHVKIRLVKEITLKVEVIYGGGATEQTCTVKLDREKLKVSGSNAKLGKMTELVIGTIYLDEYSADDTITLNLKDILEENGLVSVTGTEQVNVSIQFFRLITKTFTVKNITYVNAPSGFEVDIITEERIVTVRGPAEQIEAMQAENIELVVDFAGASAGITDYEANVNIKDNAYSDVGAVGTYKVTANLTAAA